MASEDGGCRACADLTAAEFVRLVASMEGVAVAKVPEPPLGIVPGDVLRDLEGRGTAVPTPSALTGTRPATTASRRPAERRAVG